MLEFIIAQTVTVNTFTAITNMAGATQVTSTTFEVPIESVKNGIVVSPKLKGDLSTNEIKIEAIETTFPNTEILQPTLELQQIQLEGLE